ncbi:MAG: hypothetical protein V4850_01640 [Myxococcota bacterium]
MIRTSFNLPVSHVTGQIRNVVLHLAESAFVGAGAGLQRGAALGVATGMALVTALAPRGVSNNSCPDLSCAVTGRKLRG